MVYYRNEENVMNEEKKKALDLALSHIEKQYGSGAVMRLGEKPDANVEAIPTGALSLDIALGGPLLSAC